MSSIILTITSNITTASFDMEVPDDVVVSKVTADIAECMSAMLGQSIAPDSVALVDNRLDTILDPNSTLAELGVWNGDYLTFIVV